MRRTIRRRSCGRSVRRWLSRTLKGRFPSAEREDAALSYEISKVTSRRIEAMGAIRKLTVAVMVDGTYEGEGEARTFVPRIR